MFEKLKLENKKEVETKISAFLTTIINNKYYLPVSTAKINSPITLLQYVEIFSKDIKKLNII